LKQRAAVRPHWVALARVLATTIVNSTDAQLSDRNIRRVAALAACAHRIE
jgi:hypothetical protein